MKDFDPDKLLADYLADLPEDEDGELSILWPPIWPWPLESCCIYNYLST
jgi:hypothetical protein